MAYAERQVCVLLGLVLVEILPQSSFVTVECFERVTGGGRVGCGMRAPRKSG